MSKYSFDEIVNRRNTNSAKWDVKGNELPMWVADMDFHVLPEIKSAIDKRNNVDAFGYIECPKEYFDAVAQWWNKYHHINVQPSQLAFCTGVVAGIDSIFKHLVPKGSNVVVQTPVYHIFFHCIKNNGLEELDNQLLYKNDNYKINFAELEEHLKLDNTKALLLCNPHNPVGRIWTKEELKRIADLCEKYNVLLISDEIHADITEPGYEFNSILTVTDNAIVLSAPTKTFNIAAIQSAFVICKDNELLERIKEGLGQDDIGEPNYFAPFAAIAAYTYGNQWVKEMRKYVFNNKKYISAFINKELPELKLIDNKATYLLWLDISHYSHDSEKFANELRDKTGLFVSNGKQFGKGGESFLRINAATSLANVKDACNRLKSFIKDYE